MAKKYVVILSEEERCELQSMISTGRSAARRLIHARVLLLADARLESNRTDQQIVEALGVSVRTVERIRQRFVEEGFEDALNPKSRPRIVSKLEKAEADLVELAKSDPPKGRKRWTLRLLADQAVQWQYLDGLSHESVRQILKKTG
jgi:transposase